MSEPTRHTLLDRLMNGRAQEDVNAFLAIYGLLISSYAKRACASLTNELNRTEGDEATANVVSLLLTGGLSSYDREKGKFRSWLWVLVRHEVASLLRKAPKHPLPVDVPDDGWSDEQDRQDQMSAVHSAISHLKASNIFHPKSLEVFDYWFNEKLSGREVTYAEAGQRFGMSEPAARNAIRGICARLREYLGDDFCWE